LSAFTGNATWTDLPPPPGGSRASQMRMCRRKRV
jgi:hypothetical protein